MIICRRNEDTYPCCKPLVQPQMSPPFHCYKIAKPLVCQFMGDHSHNLYSDQKLFVGKLEKLHITFTKLNSNKKCNLIIYPLPSAYWQPQNADHHRAKQFLGMLPNHNSPWPQKQNQGLRPYPIWAESMAWQSICRNYQG